MIAMSETKRSLRKGPDISAGGNKQNRIEAKFNKNLFWNLLVVIFIYRL